MIEDLGLHTITFQPFRDFEGTLEPQRAKVFARAERKFDAPAVRLSRSGSGLRNGVSCPWVISRGGGHAAFTPDAAWAAIRPPPRLVPG
jgi:hypothetical protein